MNCSKCLADIPQAKINIATDIAQCTQCHNVFKISENLSAQIDPSFDKNYPPSGAWIEQDFDTITLGATTRSWMALFFVPFTIVWAGGSMSGLYGSQIWDGKFNLAMSLFGIPFVIGSIFLISTSLMMVFGKVEIKLNTEGGKIFTGISIIGWTKQFFWSDVSNIREEVSYSSKGSATKSILLEGKTRLDFGSTLDEEKRYYILKSLQQILAKKEMNMGFI
jgi:hypothetical protein